MWKHKYCEFCAGSGDSMDNWLIKIFILNLILMFCLCADANYPPTTVQGQSDTSAQTKFSFQVPYNQKTDLGGTKALFETGNYNLLLNPSFEHVTFSTSWTLSAGSSAVETTNVNHGKQSAALTLSAVNGTVMSQSVTPTVQLQAVTIEYSMKVKTSQSNVQVCSLNAGSEVTCKDVASSNTWQYMTIFATGPASGSVGIRLKTKAGVTGTVYIDDAYVGFARNFVTNVSGAITQSATITNSGSCVISNQVPSTWLSNPAHTGTGRCTFTMANFTGAPNCGTALDDQSGAMAARVTQSSITSTFLETVTVDNTSSGSDLNFKIICHGLN